MLSRLQRAAAVPSILSVLSGLTKWYHSASVSDVRILAELNG